MVYRVVSLIEKKVDGRFMAVQDHRAIISATDAGEAKSKAYKQAEAENVLGDKSYIRPSQQRVVPFV